MAAPSVTFHAQRNRAAHSGLEAARQSATPELPATLKGEWTCAESAPVAADPKFTDTIKQLFPTTHQVPKCTLGSGQAIAVNKGLKVGVVLSGGQAPGGHNVIAGIYDAVKKTGPDFEFYGFCDGPHGVFSGNVTRIDDAMMDGFRNTGGFDMIGSGRHKIESKEQFDASKHVCEQLGLDGLVVIGGDDSNTNAALLAEYFSANSCSTKVIGCPKTIDGDLKCPPDIPVSFGFDTACRTFAELVGNVAVDALSTQKYYHFVRLMGRAASNIALEVALLTNPNICFLGEEVESKNMSLKEITRQVANVVKTRAEMGKNYGVVVLPEGLIEFIPEFHSMISEINELGDGLTEADVLARLSEENAERFRFLPAFLRGQLLLDRDPHGNVQVAKIETEKLLASCVEQELNSMRFEGSFHGHFVPQFHSFGYEGRAGLPSRFDATYCYVLGFTAGVLLAGGKTGLISSVKDLTKPVTEWVCGGVPVTSLCVVERRKGKDKPVIKKALVELDGPMSQPFKAWESIRDKLALEDHYRVPGPLQFDQACPVSLSLPMTLILELGGQPWEAHTSVPEPKSYGKFLYCPHPLAAKSQLQQWHAERISHRGGILNSSGPLTITEGAKTNPPTSVDVDAVEKALPTNFGKPLVDVQRHCGRSGNKRNLAFAPPSRKGADAQPETKQVPEQPRLGVVLCGRQAPGGHDVLCGVAAVAKRMGGEALGFVGGAKGLFDGHAVPLNDIVNDYRGTGGFDLLGRTQDRTAETEEDKEKVLKACKDLNLTGLVLVGGTRTATDVAILSEFFAKREATTSVVLVPCGIEGSLLNPFVEAQLGFDSASKTVAQLVGNTCHDGASARKYYYFLRCMDGSSTGLEITSHIALEVALATRPNVALISEEISEKRMTLKEVVDVVADAICTRAHDGKNYGTVLVPEGLLAAVPECRVLIGEIAKCKVPCSVEQALPQLSHFSAALLQDFPPYMQRELLLERQSNGQIQLSQVSTEQLLADLVAAELKKRKRNGDEHPVSKEKAFVGSFSPVCQFVGYQARCSMPSLFDSRYGHALGETAAVLAATKQSGYLASVSGLGSDEGSWRCAGAPISAIASSTDSGVRVKPTPVLLSSAAWKAWAKVRARCVVEDLYRNPGPIQLSGVESDRITETLTARSLQWGQESNYLSTLEELTAKMELLKEASRPGCDVTLARVANSMLGSMEEILSLMSEGRA